MELTRRAEGAVVVDPSTLVEEWLDHDGAANDWSEATVRAYRKGLEVFTRWLRETGNVGAVTPRVVLDWKRHLAGTYAPQTVNLRLTAVRQFYAWAASTERSTDNPARDVSGVKRSQSRRHKRDPLTGDEVRAVLATCGDDPIGRRDRAVLTLMAYCGLRTVEVVRADVRHLGTRNDRLVLDVVGKGRREADDFVVIPSDREHVVRAWLAVRPGGEGPLFVSLSTRNRGDRLTSRAVRALVKGRFEEAGVVSARKTTHSLRHSAITSAIRHGAEPMQVQGMARHGSFDTTLTYFHEEGRTADPAEDYVSYD